jgi:phenylalanyl-tRNA synthetase beta chain
VQLAEDVVEEIARVYGYEHIPGLLPSFPITPTEENKERSLEYQLRTILVHEFGFTEMYNYSFVNKDCIEKMGDAVESYLELDNPLSKERPFLRRNLVINLLENIQKNSVEYKKLKFFEITNNLINNFYNIFTQEGDFIKNLYDNIFYPINGDQSEKLLFDAVCNVIEINTSLKRPESGIYAILKKSLI